MWKICPNCEAEVHIALRECSECGFQWPETECIVAKALPEMKNVEFGTIVDSPPEWFDVENWEPSVHTSKKNNKELGRIDYYFRETDYKESRVSMFLCFPDQYAGYAVTMAQKKWPQVSDEKFPESVEDFQTKRLYIPTRILVNQNGKYPDLVEVEVREDLFVYPEEEPEDLIPF